MREPSYAVLRNELKKQYEQYEITGEMSALKSAADTAKRLEAVRRILCTLKGSTPKMVTDGKIPDSHIVFLDELFSAPVTAM